MLFTGCRYSFAQFIEFHAEHLLDLPFDDDIIDLIWIIGFGQSDQNHRYHYNGKSVDVDKIQNDDLLSAFKITETYFQRIADCQTLVYREESGIVFYLGQAMQVTTNLDITQISPHPDVIAKLVPNITNREQVKVYLLQ